MDDREEAPSLDRDQAATAGYGLDANRDYLDRCQVDTPHSAVTIVWNVAHRYRDHFADVFDPGAGDGRFARAGTYVRYFGFEIDAARLPSAKLSDSASIVNGCAFSDPEDRLYDLAIGNPPYVRHHDITDDWRARVSSAIAARSGVRPSGLSNAYIYFLWLGLLKTNADGVVAMLVPQEWVSRPAGQPLRDYIERSGWSVDVYRFSFDVFDRVLTTSCVTVIDKRAVRQNWRTFVIDSKGAIKPESRKAAAGNAILGYSARQNGRPFAQRGLSSGSQRAFILTEHDRLRHGLERNLDVLPCVTSLRLLSSTELSLTNDLFETAFVQIGLRCWLVNPERAQSSPLRVYLDQVAASLRNTATCRARVDWWQFKLPPISDILYASGFVGEGPKAYVNEVGAVAVGAVCGIHDVGIDRSPEFVEKFRSFAFRDHLANLSNGFCKVEVKQVNCFLSTVSEIE